MNVIADFDYAMNALHIIFNYPTIQGSSCFKLTLPKQEYNPKIEMTKEFLEEFVLYLKGGLAALEEGERQAEKNPDWDAQRGISVPVEMDRTND